MATRKKKATKKAAKKAPAETPMKATETAPDVTPDVTPGEQLRAAEASVQETEPKKAAKAKTLRVRHGAVLCGTKASVTRHKGEAIQDGDLTAAESKQLLAAGVLELS